MKTPPCPGCGNMRRPGQYLCPRCWYRLRPHVRRALNRKDDMALSRFCELVDQLTNGPALEEIDVTP